MLEAKEPFPLRCCSEGRRSSVCAVRSPLELAVAFGGVRSCSAGGVVITDEEGPEEIALEGVNIESYEESLACVACCSLLFFSASISRDEALVEGGSGGGGEATPEIRRDAEGGASLPLFFLSSSTTVG